MYSLAEGNKKKKHLLHLQSFNIMSTRALILVNLGSPESTSVKDVRKYLNEFLMDERVIDIPYLLRLFLVKGIIAPFRAPKSVIAYKSVWMKEGSPLIVISKQLQQEVQKISDIPVEIAMRYGNPTPVDVYNKLAGANPDLEEVIVMPLYPHYAMSSYETAAEYMITEHKKRGYGFKLKMIQPFYKNENYLNALSECIRPYMNQPYDKILFSYHGVPERHIKKGDITGCHCLQKENCCTAHSPAHDYCYRHQCYETTKLVAEKLQIPTEKMEQTFQSRLGRDPWLTPYTAARLEQLPGEGVKNLLIVCPAFVSDCLETLEEIAEEGKESFLHAGGKSFTVIPCLNTQDDWIKTVALLTGIQQEEIITTV